MNEKLPTLEEIIKVHEQLENATFDEHGNIRLVDPDPYQIWVLKNADKVIENYDEWREERDRQFLEKNKALIEKQMGATGK